MTSRTTFFPASIRKGKGGSLADFQTSAKSEELTTHSPYHARSNTTIFRNALQSIAQGARLVSTDLDSISAKCHLVPLVKKLLDAHSMT